MELTMAELAQKQPAPAYPIATPPPQASASRVGSAVRRYARSFAQRPTPYSRPSSHFCFRSKLRGAGTPTSRHDESSADNGSVARAISHCPSRSKLKRGRIIPIKISILMK